MESRRRRSRWLVASGAIASCAVAAILVAGPASADTTTKPYTVTVTVTPDANAGDADADAWVGSTPTITIVIRNDAFPQTLGSANIVVPEGIVPDPPLPSGNVIELRNLNLAPGETASASLTARIPCVPDPNGYAWTVEVKQSNDFNGTGNDFTAATPPPRLYGAGECGLRFLDDGQPASAQRLTSITADPYLPTGGRAVAVRAVDGSPDRRPVTWWSEPITLAIASGFNAGGGVLGGTTVAVPIDGVARFLSASGGPTIDRSAGSYRLTASSPGLTAAPVSRAFDIVDSGQRCRANSDCTGRAASGRFSASVTTKATFDDDLLVMSLGAPDAPAVDCPLYAETTDTLAFDVTTLAGAPSGSAKTVVYTIFNPVKSAPQYDVCFRTLATFTTKSSTPASAQPDGSYVGLLPDCRRVGGVAPCVADRARVGGSVVLTITAPQGDPWMRG